MISENCFNFVNNESLDVKGISSNGFVSYSARRLVGNRISELCLWTVSGQGLAFEATSVDVSDRLEVGLVKVSLLKKREDFGLELDEFALSSAFQSPTDVFLIKASVGGVLVDNGFYFLTKSCGELSISCANFPNAISLMVCERTLDYEPEYYPPDCSYVEI